jgi:membrane-associated phospholipid phosphatase
MADTDSGTVSAASPLALTPLRGKINARRLILYVLAWLAVLAVVLPFDARISTWFDALAHQNPIFLRVMKISRYPFSTWAYFAVAAVLLLRQDRWRALIGFAVPVGACFGTVHLLKFVIGRARPDQNFGPFHFDLFGDPFAGLDGLPSAHTAAAVLLTALLFRYFRPSAWLLIPAAVLASLSRVAQERHYLSDVIVGAGIPLLAVWLCIQLFGAEFYPQLTRPAAPDSSSAESQPRSA